jgi:hypothetical protein
MAKTQSTEVSIVLESLVKESKPLQKKLSDLKVVDNESYDLAATLMKNLKTLASQAEASKKKITDPINASLKAVREHFRPFEQTVDALQQDTKQKMQAFLLKQEQERAKLEKKFEQGDIKKVSTLVKKQEELTATSASAKVRKIQKLKIVDVKKIPREYLVPNESLILEDLKAGKKVAGCEIELVNSIAI